MCFPECWSKYTTDNKCKMGDTFFFGGGILSILCLVLKVRKQRKSINKTGLQPISRPVNRFIILEEGG